MTCCKVQSVDFLHLQVNTGSGTHREPGSVRIAPKATFKAFQLELNAPCVKKEHMRMRQRLQNAKNVSCLLAYLEQYLWVAARKRVQLMMQVSVLVAVPLGFGAIVRAM